MTIHLRELFGPEITYTARIERHDINSAYKKCISWFQTKDAEILEERKPNHIKAIQKQIHEKRFYIEIIDEKEQVALGKKVNQRIIVFLVQDFFGIFITVQIISEGGSYWEDPEYWFNYIDNLYLFLGAVKTPQINECI